MNKSTSRREKDIYNSLCHVADMLTGPLSKKLEEVPEVSTKPASPTSNKSVSILNVVFNKPATIIFWSDGTKTVVKCAKEDSYDKLFGFFICVLTKLIGKNSVRKLYEIYTALDEEEEG